MFPITLLNTVAAEDVIVTDVDGREYRLLDSNYSCIKSLAQYTINEQEIDVKDIVKCGNCTR